VFFVLFIEETRALSQNVTNAAKEALIPNFKKVKVTFQNKLLIVENFPDKIKV